MAERTRSVPQSVATRHAARWTNVVLGAWLFLSAFLLQRTVAEQTNAWIVGLLILGVALGARRVPELRYVNVITSVYLFVCAIVLEDVHPGLAWHDGLLAALVFLAAWSPHHTYVGRPRTLEPPRRFTA
ncbi:MAG: SPW repeat protein [Myxococcaceae bacterium]|nr:SPW repeat protein [Myxococcaceae bacterium]